MDGLIGFLLMLLGWGAMALQQAQKARKQRQAEAAGAPPLPGGGASPPRWIGAREAAASAQLRLEQAVELPAASRPKGLAAELERTLEEARSLDAALEATGTATPESTLEAQALLRRAHVLEAFARQHASSDHGALLLGAAGAIERAVPGLEGRVVVTRHESENRGDAELAGSGLAVLSLDPAVRRRPWAAAELVEEAWAHELLQDGAAPAAALRDCLASLPTESAIDRFAQAFAAAWAPALLVDVATTLGLGSGHAARVQRLAGEGGAEQAWIVRLDGARRVDGRPPPGLRLALLGRLLRRLGLEEGAALAGPPPAPGAELELRGPGIWERVPLDPLFDAAAAVQEALRRALGSRPGLDRTAEIDRTARALHSAAASGPAPEGAEPRALLAALGLCAALAPAAGRELLESLEDRSGLAAEPAPAPAARAGAGLRRPAADRPSEDADEPRSRARAVRQALMLGAALGEPPR